MLDISRSEKKKTATSDQAAEDATIETQYNTSNSNGSHKTRNSIKEKLRLISHIGVKKRGDLCGVTSYVV